jgi:L-Ala-D/L-Glu epimerase
VTLWFFHHILKNTVGLALIGRNPLEIERIHDIMDGLIYGSPTAKAAIDIPCYDIFGKKIQQPIYQLIGSRYPDEFPIILVLSSAEPGMLADEAAAMVETGTNPLR